eukprot:gene28165-31264_t
MLIPATCLLLFVLALPFVTGDTNTIVFTAGALLFGFTLYPLLQIMSKRGWCEFEKLHFDVAGVYSRAATDESHADPVPLSAASMNGEGHDEDLPPSLCHHNMRVEAVVPGLHALVDNRAASLDLAFTQPLLSGGSNDDPEG